MRHMLTPTGVYHGAARAYRATASAATAAAIGVYVDPRKQFLALCAALTAVAAVMSVAAGPAFAGEGAASGSPDQINTTIDNAVQWFSGIVVGLGVLGLIVASLFWIFAGANSRTKERAGGWVIGCVLAITVAFLAPSIVATLQEWTNAGGGGG